MTVQNRYTEEKKLSNWKNWYDNKHTLIIDLFSPIFVISYVFVKSL